MADMPLIKLGDYIVLQRQKYTKLQKFGSLDATAMLGKDQLELRALCDQPYGTTFKMCPKEGNGRHSRVQTLHPCSELEMRNIREVLGINAAGPDNRHIHDDSNSQALGPDDIAQLRNELAESTKIIEKIVENSKTFSEKTEYSQEKYLKKKEKKYFEYVQIRQPTIRMLTEIYFRQDPEKVMGLRIDTLSQLLSYANVSAYGDFLLYESGTNGLLPASFLDCFGANTEARLVHMTQGNVPQRQAILALNLPEELLQRCISVNIYSVLREYYQGDKEHAVAMTTTTTSNARSSTVIDSVNDEDMEICCKRQKLEDESTTNSGTGDSSKQAHADAAPLAGIQKWKLENKLACAIMHTKFDSLVLAVKEHPATIFDALLPLVKPSRPIVVFSPCKEVLMELYVTLKSNSKVTNLHLTSNWLRIYQILPNRTHPEVNMNGNSGYLLWGYTVE